MALAPPSVPLVALTELYLYELLCTDAAQLLSLGWCRGCYARDEKGERVDPIDPKASAWCLTGALIRVAHRHGVRHVPYPLRERIRDCFPAGFQALNLHEYNDDVAQDMEDVRAALLAARSLIADERASRESAHVV